MSDIQVIRVLELINPAAEQQDDSGQISAHVAMDPHVDLACIADELTRFE